MKRIKLTLAVILIVGVLAAIPGSAQSTGTQTNTDYNYSLSLLIAINQMQLSSDQMQQIHDILAGIITQANKIGADRDAFTAEMLTFTGSSDDLNAQVTEFQTKMEEARTALRQSWQEAIDQIEGILTVKQAEILQNGLRPVRAGIFGVGLPQPNTETNQGNQPMQSPGAGWQSQQQAGQEDGQGTPPMGMQEGMFNNFGLRGRIAPQMGNTDQQTDQCVPNRHFSLMHGFGGRMSMSQQTGERGIAMLQQIVDILEAKLQQ